MDEALRTSMLTRCNAEPSDSQDKNMNRHLNSSKKNEQSQEKVVFPDCAICGDKSTGKHYKVFSCEGCKNFFRRSIRNQCRYKCPAYGTCPVERDQRTRCKACRMKKCLHVGMKKEAVQCERKPLVLVKSRTPPNSTPDLSPNSEGSTRSEKAEDNNDPGRLHAPNRFQNGTPSSETVQSNDAPQTKASVTVAAAMMDRSTSPLHRNGVNVGSITSTALPFHIDQPAMAMTDLGYLYEMSTRLLFATIDWVRGLTAFNRLSEQDRMRLVIDKWGCLFAISIAQCAEMFPLSTLLALTTSERGTDRRYFSPLLRWNTFQKLKTLVLNGIAIGKCNKNIYDQIKIVTLFDQALSGLLEPSEIAETRKVAQMALEETLSQSMTATDQSGDIRTRIIAVLESAHDLSTQEITEAFFSPIVKETSVEFIVGATLLGTNGADKFSSSSPVSATEQNGSSIQTKND